MWQPFDEIPAAVAAKPWTLWSGALGPSGEWAGDIT
jgi:hypothetical protein